jgi:hypothetical protein
MLQESEVSKRTELRRFGRQTFFVGRDSARRVLNSCGVSFGLCLDNETEYFCSERELAHPIEKGREPEETRRLRRRKQRKEKGETNQETKKQCVKPKCDGMEKGQEER